MGIRTFTFGGTSSGDYNMFITSASTYGAPERAVEMLEIPGRNGHYALDQGRFENVEVTYHVVVHDNNNTSFQAGMSDVRNWLCSQIGYQRLEDDYNANEYRMAVYRGGLEVEGEDTFWNGAEFDIVFDCKPQRWLTSGETAVTVADGGTLDNPTLFEAEPLLAVEGYGTIGFNGYEIELENVLIGDVTIYEGSFIAKSKTLTIDTSSLNIGDTITISGTFSSDVTQTSGLTSVTNSNASFTTDTSTKETTFGFTLTCGTSQTITNNQVWTYSGGATKQTIETIKYQTGTSAKLSFEFQTNVIQSARATWSVSAIGDSTLTALGNPTYIDCDIGECYMLKSGEIVSLNAYIDLGSDLPKLPPGTNTFSYDNTVTELQVTPRWWKV